MGAVGGMLGLNGGAGGTGFANPRMADIKNPVNQGQIDQSYTGVQDSMKQQKDLLAALQQQNGLANQNQVYGQLQGVANGTGPNPALAQLNQSTGQNVANQSAMMAGQRGAGQNVGLMARQAGQIGSGIQQQAVGQAATMQAQQQLAAINSAGGMANTQAGNLVGQTNANAGTAQAEQGSLLNAQTAYNNSLVGGQNSMNSANAAMASEGMKNQAGMIGGLMQGAGAFIGKAHGGEVRMANGGMAMSKVGQSLSRQSGDENKDPLRSGASTFAQGIGGLFRPTAQDPMPMAGGPMDNGGLQTDTMMAARGGQVPVLLSPGEIKLSPEQAAMVAQGRANPMAIGKVVPGKPRVGGAKNDYANDTVPDKVPAGTVIVPRSESMSKDPDRNSRDFVQKSLAKRKVGK